MNSAELRWIRWITYWRDFNRQLLCPFTGGSISALLIRRRCFIEKQIKVDQNILFSSSGFSNLMPSRSEVEIQRVQFAASKCRFFYWNQFRQISAEMTKSSPNVFISRSSCKVCSFWSKGFVETVAKCLFECAWSFASELPFPVSKNSAWASSKLQVGLFRERYRTVASTGVRLSNTLEHFRVLTANTESKSAKRSSGQFKIGHCHRECH